MSLKLRAIFGVEGIAPLENKRARKWGLFFKRMIIPIMVLLVFQHNLYFHHVIGLKQLLNHDWFLWGFFFIEEIILTYLVDNKKQFILHNWLNLLIIFLIFPPFVSTEFGFITFPEWRFLLLFRLLPALWDAIVGILRHNRIRTTLIVTAIITILWGGLIPLIDPTIANSWDGIWLAWETVTTVGFGDIYPRSIMGRLSGIILMVVGVALTSLLTANFASYILRHKDKRTQRFECELMAHLKELEKKIDALSKERNK